MVRRRGLGRIRHLDTTDLWLQERIRGGGFRVTKIDGDKNTADILTMNVERATLVKHLAAMGMHHEEGRAESAPKLVHQS